MDVLTQGLIGAGAAGALLGWTQRVRSGADPGAWRSAILAGAAGGLLPDADIFLNAIPGLIDPAWPWALHRHFTHALVAVPAVGLVAALPWLLWPSGRTRFAFVWLAATIGALTHGPLDNCTSFGTHLWWPFIGERTAWDSIAIVDPMVSLPLLLGVIAGLLLRPLRARVWTTIGFALAVAALGLGFLQHARAERALERHVAALGETPARLRVMPTLGNTILWRGLRETRDDDGRRVARAAAVRVPWFGPATVRDGEAHALASAGELAWPDDASAIRAKRVLGALDDFADGWAGFVGEPPHDEWSPFLYADHRYSLRTTGFEPLWGIAAAPGDPIEPLRWGSFMRDGSDGAGRLAELWREIVGAEQEEP